LVSKYNSTMNKNNLKKVITESDIQLSIMEAKDRFSKVENFRWDLVSTLSEEFSRWSTLYSIGYLLAIDLINEDDLEQIDFSDSFIGNYLQSFVEHLEETTNDSIQGDINLHKEREKIDFLFNNYISDEINWEIKEFLRRQSSNPKVLKLLSQSEYWTLYWKALIAEWEGSLPKENRSCIWYFLRRNTFYRFTSRWRN